MRNVGNGYARGINASGYVTGNATFTTVFGPDLVDHAFIYHDWKMTDIGNLCTVCPTDALYCARCRSAGHAINDSGQVTGTSQFSISSYHSHAFLYSNGKMTDLGTLGGGDTSTGYGINASGQVVGSSYIAGNITQHAFLYSDGKMIDLGTLNGGSSQARGINANGDIVGFASYPSYYESIHAFLYRNGVMTDLNDLLPADEKSRWTLHRAYGINDAGQIVGVGFHNGSIRAFLLSPIGEFKLSTASLKLVKGGAAGSYTMALADPPSADVVVTVSHGTQLTASPTQLTFTPANWNIPQTVRVQAIQNNISERPHIVTLTHAAVSTDRRYNGIAIGRVDVTITDPVVPVATIPATSGTAWTRADLPVTGTAAPGATVTVTATNLTTGAVTAVSAAAGANGTWSLTLTGLTDGHYELWPEAGGINGGKLTLTVDVTGRLRPVLLPPLPDGVIWNRADLPLRGTAPAGATVTLHVKNLHNDATGTYTAVADADGNWSILVPNLEDCHYQLQAAVNGLFGNQLVFYVDSHAPATTLSVGLASGGAGGGGGGSAGGWHAGAIAIGLAADDSAGGHGVGVDRIEYSLNDGAWSAFPATGLILDRDGSYSFCYRAVDNAGNVEAARCVPLLIDATAPAVTPRFDAGSNLLILDAADGGSGIASLEFSLDGGASWSGTTGAVGFPRDGVYTVRYRCRDKAGNIIIGQVTVTAVTPPGVVPPPEQSAIEGRAQAFELGLFTDQGSDSPWRVEIDWGDGSREVQTVAAPGSLGSRMHTYADNGTYTVTLKVTDAAGNSGSTSFRVAVGNVAPSVGPVSAPAAPVEVNAPVSVSAGFTDPGVLDSHTATIDWGDGTTGSGSVSEANGAGSAVGTHRYAVPGLYTVKVTVTDKDGGAGSSSYQYVVVVDPNGPFVTGGGQAEAPEGRAQFSFVVNYKGQATPSGHGQFKLTAGRFDFRSSGYDWLVAASGKAVFAGSGTLNGAGGYGYLVSLIDAGSGRKGADAIRIRIWNKESGVVEYDTQPGAADTADPILLFSGGNIAIHE